jgi:hypothetical protein
VAVVIGVNGDEQDGALVLLGNVAGRLKVAVEVTSLLREEQQQVRADFASEDFLGGVVVELDDQGQCLGGDKLGDRVRGQLAFEIGALIVELGRSKMIRNEISKNVDIIRRFWYKSIFNTI